MSPGSSAQPTSSPAADEGITQRRLLRSIVEVARGVFAAAAASVFLVDRADGSLVFEAVSGEGEEELVGQRFPSGTGIAGWVASFGQPLLIDDLADSPQFARDAAESTGYVPQSIMAAPLIRNGECIGVLEVLDRGTRPRAELGDMDLLTMLATELAMALDLLIHLRWSRSADPVPGQPASDDLLLIQRIADWLPRADGPAATTVRRLLEMAADLIDDSAADGDTAAGGDALVR
jgi:GAF domain-containing protein